MNNGDCTSWNAANSSQQYWFIKVMLDLPHYDLEWFLGQQCFLLFQHDHFQMPSAEKSSDEGKKTKKVSQKLSNTST